MKKLKFTIIIFIIFIVLLVACSNQDSAEIANNEEVATETLEGFSDTQVTPTEPTSLTSNTTSAESITTQTQVKPRRVIITPVPIHDRETAAALKNQSKYDQSTSDYFLLDYAYNNPELKKVLGDAFFCIRQNVSITNSTRPPKNGVRSKTTADFFFVEYGKSPMEGEAWHFEATCWVGDGWVVDNFSFNQERTDAYRKALDDDPDICIPLDWESSPEFTPKDDSEQALVDYMKKYGYEVDW